MGRDQDDTVIVPYTTAMYRLFGKVYVDSIETEIKDPALIPAAKDDLSKLIIERHRLSEKEQDSFQIIDLAEIQQALASTTQTISLLLGCIAAISLIVGGIGIMNIMLVSVTERIREIGLRKAIGARRIDILSQFLIEAVVMTLTGGLLGILGGVGAASALASLAGWPVKVSLWSIVMSAGFSALIGVCFGLWPAVQASRLNPVDALRYE
jgi:macrolide transport system ATP-binding/permease protein